MFYEKLSYREIKKYREKPFFLPVGTIEPHSDAPLGTDVLIPNYIAEYLARKFKGVKMPPVYYGITSSLYGYPGAVRIEPDIFKKYIQSIGIALKRSGVKYLFIINGHGGQIDELKDVASFLWHRHNLFTAVINWWIVVENISKEFFGSYTGHGGADEVAMVSFTTDYNVEKWEKKKGFLYIKGTSVYPFPKPQIHYEEGEGRIGKDKIKEYRDKVFLYIYQKTKKILKAWEELQDEFKRD